MSRERKELWEEVDEFPNPLKAAWEAGMIEKSEFLVRKLSFHNNEAAPLFSSLWNHLL